MFNREQEAYMESLAALSKERRCACLWYPIVECEAYYCVKNHPGARTIEDRMARLAKLDAGAG